MPSYQGVILAFEGIFCPEKRVLQDMICCPSAVNKYSFKRTYYSIFGKECFFFGNIICCPFRMECLAPYTVPLGPTLIISKLTFSAIIFFGQLIVHITHMSWLAKLLVISQKI